MIAIMLQPQWLPQETAQHYLKDLQEEVRFFSDYNELQPVAKDVEILLNTLSPTKEDLQALPNLRWVFSYSAGVDGYPLDYFREHEVALTNTSGIHKTNIAEQVLGAMILFSRNLYQALRQMQERLWQSYPLGELKGQSLLIVGSGAIGREIACKAKAFDLQVLGIRRTKDGEDLANFDAMGTLADLPELLGQADYVVNVLPLTKATRGLFDESAFNAMKPSAVFLSVGRGETVREADLIRALEEKKIAGAYLDVFEQEPLAPSSPLWGLDRVVLTPHNAGPTPHYHPRAMAMFLDNLRRFRSGEPLLNRVDPGAGY
ncbi:D-3-phosphoglycerate dehydrogenase [Clostridiaceae bacterium JG1575]|nr:D-3-phosphoglycerate dehydrogenase [Clostridiaceae bacterium JG1575]